MTTSAFSARAPDLLSAVALSLRAAPVWAPATLITLLVGATANAVFVLTIAQTVADHSQGEPISRTVWVVLAVSLGSTLLGPQVAELTTALWTEQFTTRVHLETAEAFLRGAHAPARDEERATAMSPSEYAELAHSWDIRHFPEAVYDWVSNRVRGVASIVVIALWSPLLAVCAFAGMLLAQHLHIAPQISSSPDSGRQKKQADVLQAAALDPRHRTELFVHGLMPWLTRQVRCRLAHVQATARREYLRTLRREVRNSAPAVLTFALVIATAVAALLNGSSPAGPVAVLQAVSGLSGFGALAGVDRIFASYTRWFTGTRRAAPAELPLPDENLRPSDGQRSSGVVVERVSFTYDGSTSVLDEVSLAVEPGQIVAIVGQNGAGKSTLAQLLAGSRLPGAGEITVDGTSAARAHTLGHIAFMPQTPFALPGDVFYNSSPWLGSHRELHDSCPVCEHLELASLCGGDGGDGRQMQGLSGGELQRVNVARALHAVQRGSRLLLLDEPSAALDVGFELKVMQLLREVLDRHPSACAVVVSHRFSTVRLADTILVMQEGSIVERGSHAQLMREDGLYAQLYRTQARVYA
ncbi:ATP-binding cassette, subfamily B [Austwickia chelonae]|uniref:ABC transporter domain-containing protein n=1 Tax=Austwickia chelonae NBRC 105200 TaxID=1184607 RepID=K6VLX2_9MICO|nr:ABC transporter ATP-binding protein [Austwickia chelonae]GAB77734.1 hypothetical protein AUCHE_06_00060 [Austwickia chelonae NBRC 105200]SEV88509.1 ATP-binding cassette, subfamily B [Austwickia chelonae]